MKTFLYVILATMAVGALCFITGFKRPEYTNRAIALWVLSGVFILIYIQMYREEKEEEQGKITGFMSGPKRTSWPK